MAISEGVAETFIKTSALKTRVEKIEHLRKNFSPAMEIIVTAAFHPQWEWLLPEGPCPYNKNITSKAHDFQGVLFSESRKLHIYRKAGGYDNMNKIKREVHYQEWIQSMDPDDAFLIEGIRCEGKIPYKGITEKLIKEAYPALFAKWS